jgi:hypothetical protein
MAHQCKHGATCLHGRPEGCAVCAPSPHDTNAAPANPAPADMRVRVTKGGIMKLMTKAEAQQVADLMFWPEDPRAQVLRDAAEAGTSHVFTDYSNRR